MFSGYYSSIVKYYLHLSVELGKCLHNPSSQSKIQIANILKFKNLIYAVIQQNSIPFNEGSFNLLNHSNFCFEILNEKSQTHTFYKIKTPTLKMQKPETNSKRTFIFFSHLSTSRCTCFDYTSGSISVRMCLCMGLYKCPAKKPECQQSSDSFWEPLKWFTLD